MNNKKLNSLNSFQPYVIQMLALIFMHLTESTFTSLTVELVLETNSLYGKFILTLIRGNNVIL